jgi:hypothetical protein
MSVETIQYTQGKLEYAPHIQLLVFVLAVAFYLVYYGELFSYKKYNKFALMMSLVLFVWFLSLFVRYVYKIKITDDKMFDTPLWVNCLVGQAGWERGCFSFWTLAHLIFWIVVGVVVGKGLLLEVFAISVIYEIIEHMVGTKSQMIIDPIVNCAGYLLGAALSLEDC